MQDNHFDGQRRGIFAHTSPIYVACGGNWRMFDEDVARRMLSVAEGNLTYIQEISPQYSPGTVTHPHGELDHFKHLSRPFMESRDLIIDKLRKHGISP